jgi:hypothetical protein
VYVMQVNVYEKAVVKFRCSVVDPIYVSMMAQEHAHSSAVESSSYELRGTIGMLPEMIHSKLVDKLIHRWYLWNSCVYTIFWRILFFMMCPVPPFKQS